jgi:phosphohistidine phosphatase
VTRRRLILLRHAPATETRPGGRDIDRELTELGEQQARGVGDFLRHQGVEVDAVVCSSAVRARQTLERLALPIEPSRVELSEDCYNAGVDTLLEVLRALPEDCAVALLVGHAPGVPGVAFELADAEASDSAAMAAIERRFPAAAIAQLEFTGAWADVADAVLVDVWFPDASERSEHRFTDR